MPRRPSRSVLCHSRIDEDVELILKHLEASEDDLIGRTQARQQLEEIVTLLEGGTGDYELVDISVTELCRFNLRGAPLELAIVDKSRPRGLEPSFHSSPLPVFYDGDALLSAFNRNGFTGVLFDRENANKEIESEDTCSTAEKIGFNPFQSSFLVRPSVLRFPSTSALVPEIHLHPAHPSNLVRWELLTNFRDRLKGFSRLLAIFWTWLRTKGICQISPYTCALLVIHWYQIHYKLPPLKNVCIEADATLVDLSPTKERSDSLDSDFFWIRYYIPTPQPEPSPTYLKIPIPKIIDTVQNNVMNTGHLFIMLLEYWCSHNFSTFQQKVLSVRSATWKTRQIKFEEASPNLSTTEGKSTEILVKEAHEKVEMQCYSWQYQPVVVEDIVLPQENVAAVISKTEAKRFLNTVRDGFSILKKGHSVISLFDKSLLMRELSRKGQVIESDSRLLHSTAIPSSDPVSMGFEWPLVSYHILVERSLTIRRVESAIRKQYGNHYSVECFGSTRYGVDNSQSDLDLVIIDHDRKYGFSPLVNRLPQIYGVRHLAQTLRKADFILEKTIPSASVPIVKFRDPSTNLSCDINVNDQLGLFNTLLITKYCSFDPILKQMLRAIKTWAKSFGYNNPSDLRVPSSFTSYSLALMTIGFLQTKGSLPNLQAGLPPLTVDGSHLDGTFWVRKRNGDRMRCDYRFNDAKGWTPSFSYSNLREALIDWFNFWGHEFDGSKEFMSVRAGGLLPRTQEPPGDVITVKASEIQNWTEHALNEILNSLSIQRPMATEVEDVFNEEDIHEDDEAGAKVDNLVEDPEEQVEQQSLFSPLEEDVRTLELHESMPVRSEKKEEREVKGKEREEEEGKLKIAWAGCDFVVQDPFIVNKNTCANVGLAVQRRFITDCRRAALILEISASNPSTSSGASGSGSSPFELILGGGLPSNLGSSSDERGKAFQRGKWRRRGRWPRETHGIDATKTADPTISHNIVTQLDAVKSADEGWRDRGGSRGSKHRFSRGGVRGRDTLAPDHDPHAFQASVIPTDDGQRSFSRLRSPPPN